MNSKKLSANLLTRNFMYFMSNFPPHFIEEVWKDDERLAIHLREKMRGKIGDAGYISVQVFSNFFYDLSSDNQLKLIDWVNKHYNGIGLPQEEEIVKIPVNILRRELLKSAKLRSFVSNLDYREGSLTMAEFDDLFPDYLPGNVISEVFNACCEQERRVEA